MALFRLARINGGQRFVTVRPFDLLSFWFWQAYDKIEPIGQDASLLAYLINVCSEGKIGVYDAFPPYSQMQEIILGWRQTKEGAAHGRYKLLQLLGLTQDEKGNIVPHSIPNGPGEMKSNG